MFVVRKLDPLVEQNSISLIFLVHGETPEGAEVVFVQVFTISTFIQSDDGLWLQNVVRELNDVAQRIIQVVQDEPDVGDEERFLFGVGSLM